MTRKTKIFSFEGSRARLRSEFWREQGFFQESDFEFLPEASSDSKTDFAVHWAELWPGLSRSASCILVEESQAAFVMTQFQSLPAEIRSLQSCDCIINIEGSWWVKNLWAQALKESLVARVPQLDTHRAAYLTGKDGYARSSLAVLANFGFKKINWIAQDLAELEGARDTFLKSFFGIELSLLPSEELTLQPNNGTILVNTILFDETEVEKDVGGPHSEENLSDMHQNLIYLNFLHKGGAAVDAGLRPLESQLLTEAESVGVFSVPGWYLEGVRDHLLLPYLKANLPSQKLPTLEDYLKEWLKFLKTRPTSSQK